MSYKALNKYIQVVAVKTEQMSGGIYMGTEDIPGDLKRAEVVEGFGEQDPIQKGSIVLFKEEDALSFGDLLFIPSDKIVAVEI